MLYFKDLVFNNNIFVRIFCIFCTHMMSIILSINIKNKRAIYNNNKIYVFPYMLNNSEKMTISSIIPTHLIYYHLHLIRFI